MTSPGIDAETALASVARIVEEFASQADRFVPRDWAGRRPGPRMLSRWQQRIASRSEPELQLDGIEIAFWITELGPLMLGPAHAHCCRSDPQTAAVYEDVAVRLITRAVATDLALQRRRKSTSGGE